MSERMERDNLKRETDNINAILRQLSWIKDFFMAQVDERSDPIWKQDVNALEAGICILNEIRDAGATTVTDAVTMVRRFGASQYPTYSDGVWHCPSCNGRIRKAGHSYCHRCGQKLAWKTN